MNLIKTKEYVLAAALMALAIVLYIVDKQLTVPLNAIWNTGGATTLAYFLPVMILGAFFPRRLFFVGVIALLFAMFIVGTSAKSLVDYILEYAIPLFAAGSFMMAYPYQKIKSRFRVFLSLFITLGITFIMYVIAGVTIYGVTTVASVSYNGTLMIFPIIILSFLILPVFEVYAKLMK